MLLEKVITINEVNKILINTKESINKVIINQYNKIEDNIITGFFKEILEKYKKVNKSFFVKINKIEKIYVKIQ